VERLWRSIKYEEVYLKAYKDRTEAKQGIGTYLDLYNRVRPHQALGYRTPREMFQREQPRERPAGQEVVLIPGVNTTRSSPVIVQITGTTSVDCPEQAKIPAATSTSKAIFAPMIGLISSPPLSTVYLEICR